MVTYWTKRMGITRCINLEKRKISKVYSENDKEKLKNTVKINWSSFVDNDKKNTNTEKNEEEFEFTNEETEEYTSLIEAQASTQNTNSITIVDNDEIINVDDI